MAKPSIKDGKFRALLSLRERQATATEVRNLRTKILQVTQEEFAQIIGEGVGAVKTWEQGAEIPGGAARKVVLYLRKHPEHAKDLLVV